MKPDRAPNGKVQASFRVGTGGRAGSSLHKGLVDNNDYEIIVVGAATNVLFLFVRNP
jgi:hypothetical protein